MRTAVFDLAPDYGYDTLTKLAAAMDMSIATVSRVKSGKNKVGMDFVNGALRAFPDKTFEELFPGSQWLIATKVERVKATA